ncbi:MAG: hypothetical protein GY928_17365 [Colwellia sp.]|nr:hypothetical protein [Colwellia sp.]
MQTILDSGSPEINGMSSNTADKIKLNKNLINDTNWTKSNEKLLPLSDKPIISQT